MRFADIDMFPQARREFDVDLHDIVYHVGRWTRLYHFTMDPDFQRGHVWTEAQQVAFVEFLLRGGEVGKTIIINAPGFSDGDAPFSEVLDGKQRLTALLLFVQDKLKVFGHLYSDFEDRPRVLLKWRVVELGRRDVLKLYLSLNTGGTPHSKEDLDRVCALLKDTP